MSIVDLIRFLTILEGGIVLGLSIFVLRLYKYANRVSKEHKERIPGALPYHVAVVAASHAIMVFLLLAHGVERHGQDEDFLGAFWWWGSPLVVVAFTLSLIGLIDMLHYQQLRVHRLLKKPKVDEPMQDLGS